MSEMSVLNAGKLYRWIVYTLNGKELDAIGEADDYYIGESIRESLAKKNNVSVDQIVCNVELRPDNPRLFGIWG